jgi:hypothetical protein
MILLISASWVTRITGMSHWCLAVLKIFAMRSRQIICTFKNCSMFVWFWYQGVSSILK